MAFVLLLPKSPVEVWRIVASLGALNERLDDARRRQERRVLLVLIPEERELDRKRIDVLALR